MMPPGSLMLVTIYNVMRVSAADVASVGDAAGQTLRWADGVQMGYYRMGYKWLNDLLLINNA